MCAETSIQPVTANSVWFRIHRLNAGVCESHLADVEERRENTMRRAGRSRSLGLA